MSFGILGKKIGMTHVFDDKGNAIPVTLVNAGPCVISQIKSIENSGYNAIQLAFLEIHTKNQTGNIIKYKELDLVNNKFKNYINISKPERGHFMRHNLSFFRHLKEFKVLKLLNYYVGQQVTVDIFEIGDQISVAGLTIGKGNASNIKRNNFSRGPMSHGSKHHRLQGSLGAGTTPGRVFPGKKMSGRLGLEMCTIKKLKILFIDKTQNLLVVKGSIPGKSGNLIHLVLKK